ARRCADRSRRQLLVGRTAFGMGEPTSGPALAGPLFTRSSRVRLMADPPYLQSTTNARSARDDRDPRRDPASPRFREVSGGTATRRPARRPLRTRPATPATRAQPIERW